MYCSIRLKLLLSILVSVGARVSDLSFKNVMVTCDGDDGSVFGTVVTTNRLQPHLQGNLGCFTITIEHAIVPTLFRDSLADIHFTNFLILEDNNIREIESNAFTNTKLKEGLSLKSNKLTALERDVFKKLEVPVLILSHNKLSYIDLFVFEDIKNLKNVQLDHNELTSINSAWFKNTPKLTKINLSHNRIQSVPPEMVSNPLFSEIDLSYNMITNISPMAFTKLKKIKLLDLANNKLERLEKNWLKGVKVDVLDISKNDRVKCLRNGVPVSFHMDYVENTPWDCICSNDVKRNEFILSTAVSNNEFSQRCNIMLVKYI